MAYLMPDPRASFERLWKDLERNIEEGVRRAVARLKVPRREEVAELQARIERLSQRIDTLSNR